MKKNSADNRRKGMSGLAAPLAITIAAIVLFAFGAVAIAASLNQQPGAEGKDTYLGSGSPNKNHGIADELKVKGDDSRRTLIEFDLSSIPLNATIETAILELYVTAKGTGTPVINVYRITNNWTEGTGVDSVTDDGATWNSRNGSIDWTTSGGDYDSAVWANTTLSAKDTWYSWNITSLVQNWVNETYPKNGMMLQDVTSGTGVWKFASSDYINASLRPKLTVNYTEAGPPQINAVQLPTIIREGSNLSVTVDATDNSAVSSVNFNVGEINYSLSQSTTNASHAISIVPAAKGTFKTGLVTNYKNAYDQRNDTYGKIVDDSEKLMVKTPGIGSTGIVNSVKLKVLHAANGDASAGIHWAVSASVQGQDHAFASNATAKLEEFDVTSERNWSLSDFNMAEIHISKTGDTLLVYETWFEVNYTVTNNIWNAEIDASGWSVGNYNYTIYAGDTSNNVANQTGNFTIVPKLVLLNVTVNDAAGAVKQSRVEIYDVNNELELNETIDAPVLASVEAGSKDISVEPSSSNVKKIEIQDVNVISDVNGLINIDDPADNQGFHKIYAIDPTSLNFTNAIVTITASESSSILYKCKDWNFTTQECYGEWEAVMDITPGENYTFTLTPEDPGFGEGSPSQGTPDNGYFIKESNDETYGSYTNAQADDTSYYSVGETSSSQNGLNAYIVFEYNLTPLNISPSDISNFEFNITYCHDGSNGAQPACDGDAAEGAADGPQQVEIYNWTSASWVDIGDLRIDDGGSTILDTYNVTSGFSDFVNATNWVRVRYEGDYDNDFGEDSWLVVDYAPLTVSYDLQPVINSVSDSPDPVNRSENVIIMANVTDDVAVSSVWVGINGSNYTMDNVYGDENATAQVPTSCADDITAGENYEFYSMWTIPGSGNATLTALQFYQYDTSLAANEQMRMAIYANGSGYGRLSEIVSINGTGTIGWVNKSLATPITIELGKTYWIGIESTATYNIVRDTDANCADYLPNAVTRMITPVSGGLDSSVPQSGYINSSNHYIIPGVTYTHAAATDFWQYAYNTSSVSGLQSYTVYANDTHGNDATPAAGNFTVNETNTAPQIILDQPSNDTQINDTQTVTFNFTATDDQNATLSCSIHLNGTLNQTNSSVQNNTLTNFVINGISYGSHNWSVNCTDGLLGNVSATRDFTIADTQAPSYSDINEPADPSTYAMPATYNFNITWTDGIAVDSVRLEFDGENYTTSNVGDVHYKNFYDLPSGTYDYRWYANDTSGNPNSTSVQTFTVDKAPTTLTLNITPSSSVTYGTATNVSCSASNSEVTPQIYRDGTLVSNPDVQTLAAGDYSYICNATASQNYTEANTSANLTINKAAPVINLTLNGADSDASANIYTIVNISAALDTPSGIGVIELFEDGVFVTSTSSLVVVQRNYTSIGTINWTVQYNETQNYTSATKTHLLSITDTSGPQFSDLVESFAEPVTFSPTQDYQFNATWTDDIGISDVILEFAGVNYSWQASQLNRSGDAYSRSFSPLAAGTYNYKWYANDTSGNNASTPTQSYTIDKAVTALFLSFSPSATVTYNTSTSIGCSANNPESVSALARNGTPVGNPDVQVLAAGVYSYACTATATQNYTSASQTGTLTVNKAATTLTLTAQPASTVLNGTQTSIACSANNGEVATALYRNSANVTAPDVATLGQGSYDYACNASSSQNYTSASQSSTLKVIQINATTFTGTNWSAQNLSAIPNLTLERSEYGKIIFSGNTNLTSSVDFDSNVDISGNYISLNSTALPDFNRAATLYLHNLTFANPKIIKDGIECSACTKLSYTNGTLAFTVTGFSAYWAAEGLYCGDSVCSNGETCSSCSVDCGSCPSGGGGGGSFTCSEDWYCSEWAICSGGVQNRTCSDRNKCETIKNRPLLNQSCVSCQEDWICSEWSECTDSLQTRYCIDQNECSINRDRPHEVQSCEPGQANKTNEIVIPKLVEVQRTPKAELITLTIAMLFGLIGVLGLRSGQLSKSMKRLLGLAHITLVLSIASLLIMTFAEQPATSIISTVGQAVAGNWSIAATLLGIVGIIGAELALRGIRLPKLRLHKQKHKARQHPDESEKMQQRHKHLELVARMHAFEHALDIKLSHYGHVLQSLHRSAKHTAKAHKKLKRENAKLKNKGQADVHLQLPKLKIAVPRLSLPKPELHIKKPALPKLSLPKLAMPKLALPKLAVPKINVPKLTVPKLTMPKIAIPKRKVEQMPRTIQPQLAPERFTVKNSAQLLDLNVSEVKLGKQLAAAEKRKRAAIARMRAQFGLPAQIPKKYIKKNKVGAFRRHQL